jgi:cobalt/nickel transport system permease protein
MISIDQYAYISKLKSKDPMMKLTFCLMTLGVCLWANSMVVALLILMVMGWYTVCKGGIPFTLFLKLLTIPASFLLIGVLTIGINAADNPELFMFSIPAFGTHIGVSPKGILSAARLFMKSLGAVSCLYYLSLNTPMVDLLQALDKLGVPKLFTELMGLIYRFIFVFLETVDRMITAQKSRLGYDRPRAGYRSLAALAATLFIRAYKRSDELYTALEARGYEGEIKVLDTPFKRERLAYAVPVAVNLGLVAITLLLRHFNGGLM